MMKKKQIDSRIPTLIKNGVQEKKRTLFVIVGDRGRDQIVNLHWLLSQTRIASRPSVLWMYKKDLLGFTSHRKKREAKIKKEIKKGIRDPNEATTPFELFISVTNIRYTYYKESEKILGQTFGMLVLQDFEAITPNLLARTIETVEGGGIIVILFKTMENLKQLYTMTMDIHSRYRTEAHQDVVARFNGRFILSLGHCSSCLFVDDELNVLPISEAKKVKPLPKPQLEEPKKELEELKQKYEDKQLLRSLIDVAKTVDQARALITFVEAISEKTLRSTVALTAARGRGKSAALGLAISAAVAYGYSNIFITSPNPENLKTLFEFTFKGFNSLKYEEHIDYDIIQSLNPSFNKSIVRVNIFRNHRQTIQYIHPSDAYVLGQAELLVIDEAAAIPMPLVKKLLGPYLTFMASTVNGYEGTGRSLSLKLIQQLREQSRGFAHENTKSGNSEKSMINRSEKLNKESGINSIGGRKLREITLEEPIRYSYGDPVEEWLNKLLCLDINISLKQFLEQGCPHPSQCELYYVNRDTLFSYHPVSESFLQMMMSLYVASHYKNSPNDLQLMADAPAHQLFVLLPPVKEDDNKLPEPLCVIQVALEGEISRESVVNNLTRGYRTGGDLIPWVITEQFQDDKFASLSGARIVRIATNPEYIRMGYGSHALKLLENFYEGKYLNLSEETISESNENIKIINNNLESSLLTDDIKIKDLKIMPPLLLKLSEKKPGLIHYLGVSYGLTPQLYKFWKRAEFIPVYLRQTPNDLTGEHTCLMLKLLQDKSETWLNEFSNDFRKRFLSLLSFSFRSFPTILCLNIIESINNDLIQKDNVHVITKSEIDINLSPFDLKRLESYANNMLDYHTIIDMLPYIADLYFKGRFGKDLKMTGVQSAILLALGLQKRLLEDIEKELNLPSNQVLAMLVKILRKLSSFFKDIYYKAIDNTLPIERKNLKNQLQTHADENDNFRGFIPLKATLKEELDHLSSEMEDSIKEKQRELINSLDLQKYIIKGQEEDWDKAEQHIKNGIYSGKSSVVSIQSHSLKREHESLTDIPHIKKKHQKKHKRKV
ncbi:hypothetical protein PNEG_00425 [Pneumocystis murina B123]|uniref:RNA cytidine acetyltransferase n=1 Tax=Pneumocystis murina (strain B123) TaxID=1069680 RepID=M7NVS5_PNEMU|nr:hypothetical protein PNEG_00425 [Pneumocystis murina B123]EMR11402.1 hypothetical protein PNEG_00425 [Pneumocystis murina B123]